MSEETQIRLGGSGGQGLQLSARLLADALVREGRTVALSQSYEPTSRGGFSRADLVVADRAIDYPLVTSLDWLVLLDELAVPPCLPLLGADGSALADRTRVSTAFAAHLAVQSLPFSDVARSLGNERVANVVALGTLVAQAGLCTRDTLEAVLRAGTPAKFLDLNLEALAAGVRLAGAAGSGPGSRQGSGPAPRPAHGLAANTRT